MAISIKIDQENNLRIHTVKGTLDKKSLLKQLSEIYSDPEFREDMNALWDLREASLTSFFADDVKAIRDFVSGRWGTKGKSRAALVVSKDADYGLARMYQILSESKTSSPIRVFRDYDEALSWISEDN